MSCEALVSVIIPTYKRAVVVTSAIRSVLNQTYKNLEVLVVDDYSPDNTESMVRAIPDGRVRYLRHETNKGPSAVRNTGIKAAKGEYIAFLDDDDEWRADKLEVQLLALKDYDAVLCMGVSNGYPMRVHRHPAISLDDLRKGSFNPSSLIARTCVMKNIFFDESLRQGEDWDVFIRIAQRYTIGWVDQPLLLYNETSDGRATTEKKNLPVGELGKRTSMLIKHREFFGEKWFYFHLADAYLSYIGSRPNKLQSVICAVKRSRLKAVVAALTHRARRRIRRMIWTRA